jgi:flagellar basal-body rod protein FlgB
MMVKSLFNTQNLEKALDASWTRNEVISQNIANVDTPGYKRKEVKFEEFLNSEMKTSKIQNGESRLSGSGMAVVEDNSSSSYRIDGNNVDIEHEMALMAMNTLKYNMMIQKVSGEFTKMRSVIRGGK